MTSKLLTIDELPAWFSYPAEFVDALDSGLFDIGPWQILNGDWLRVRYEGLKKRFPDRGFVPFARRLDGDDIACWESASFPEVRVIHDFCAPGWEDRDNYLSFKTWLEAAQEEAKDFDD